MGSDLDKIRREFLQFAPAYALPQAEEALEKITALQSQGLVRSGLYYLVVSDLVGSTDYMAEHGNAAADKRIEHFVRSAFNAIGQIELTNTAIFVKEIGDAVLLIFQCFPDILRWQGEFEAYLDLFEEQRMHGVLISPFGDVTSRLKRLRDRGIPAVLVDRTTADATFSSVSVDDVAGGRMAVDHLISIGRDRVAFVGGPMQIRQVTDRLEGSRRAV